MLKTRSPYGKHIARRSAAEEPRRALEHGRRPGHRGEVDPLLGSVLAMADGPEGDARRLADVAGRPVLVGDPDVTSSAAGAARLAALGAGPALPPAEGWRRYTPAPGRTAVWDRRMAEYDEVLGRLQPFYRAWPPRSRKW